METHAWDTDGSWPTICDPESIAEVVRHLPCCPLRFRELLTFPHPHHELPLLYFQIRWSEDFLNSTDCSQPKATSCTSGAELSNYMLLRCIWDARLGWRWSGVMRVYGFCHIMQPPDKQFTTSVCSVSLGAPHHASWLATRSQSCSRKMSGTRGNLNPEWNETPPASEAALTANTWHATLSMSTGPLMIRTTPLPTPIHVHPSRPQY